MTEGLRRRVARAYDPPWWFFDGLLVVIAVAGVSAALWFHPGDDPRWVYWPSGEQMGGRCAFLEATGYPCPQCGMTRSWVHAVRGHLLTSFLHSPAGFGLFFWMVVAGALAAYRLVKRDPFAIAMPWKITVYWSFFWMIGLYLVAWFARLGGVNPLP